jgi:hypothetical protein
MKFICILVKATALKIVMLAGLVCLFASPHTAQAWSYDLTNGNSSVTVQADADYGMNNWTVDGQTQLYKQWFWYRTGASGQEKPINNLSLTSAVLTSPSTLDSVYSSSTFNIGITYALLGGLTGSGSSAVTEQIKISNLTGSALDFHFFQYVDFDLGGSWLGDTASMEQNLQGLFEKAIQTKGNAFFAEEIVSPAANHGEVGLSQSILTKLQDGLPTTLNDSTGPVTGDAVWAFQWDIVIPSYDSFTIAINKSVYDASPVPEPATLTLFGIGGIVFGALRRRLISRK